MKWTISKLGHREYNKHTGRARVVYFLVQNPPELLIWLELILLEGRPHPIEQLLEIKLDLAQHKCLVEVEVEQQLVPIWSKPTVPWNQDVSRTPPQAYHCSKQTASYQTQTQDQRHLLCPLIASNRETLMEPWNKP